MSACEGAAGCGLAAGTAAEGAAGCGLAAATAGALAATTGVVFAKLRGRETEGVDRIGFVVIILCFLNLFFIWATWVAPALKSRE